MKPIEAAARLVPRFAARAAQYDETGSFPTDDFADLRAAGLFGLMVPTRLGGMGAGFAEYARVAGRAPSIVPAIICFQWSMPFSMFRRLKREPILSMRKASPSKTP